MDLPGPADGGLHRHPGPGLSPIPAAPAGQHPGRRASATWTSSSSTTASSRSWRPHPSRPAGGRCSTAAALADHLTTVFTRPDRLPRSLRGEFLRRARVHCRRYRVPGAPAPLPVRLRHAPLRLGLRRTYEACGWRRPCAAGR
ncbi:hypothetical protein LV779_04680 [Streptomyces thinghirensis]|nr:hypothetical protein [Streptomyces thinghirensis]